MDKNKTNAEMPFDSHTRLDVLKEISNIGSGNAVTSLTKLVNKPVKIGIPNVCIMDFQEVPEYLGGHEKILVSVLVTLSGDISGMVMLVLDIHSASVLIDEVMSTSRDHANYQFDEMETSFILELGNILSSSYLGALSTMTNLKIIPSIPHMAIDMAAALVSVPAIEFGKIGDHALFIESCLDGGTPEEITAYFLLVPEAESFNTILKSLGVL